jgi:hypothetical protein
VYRNSKKTAFTCKNKTQWKYNVLLYLTELSDGYSEGKIRDLCTLLMTGLPLVIITNPMNFEQSILGQKGLIKSESNLRKGI